MQFSRRFLAHLEIQLLRDKFHQHMADLTNQFLTKYQGLIASPIQYAGAAH
jgi:hypothetical protein